MRAARRRPPGPEGDYRDRRSGVQRGAGIGADVARCHGLPAVCGPPSIPDVLAGNPFGARVARGLPRRAGRGRRTVRVRVPQGHGSPGRTHRKNRRSRRRAATAQETILRATGNPTSWAAVTAWSVDVTSLAGTSGMPCSSRKARTRHSDQEPSPVTGRSPCSSAPPAPSGLPPLQYRPARGFPPEPSAAGRSALRPSAAPPR